MLIREENLEYISRYIGDFYSGYPLSEKLKKIGVPVEAVIYPNTKWRMVFDAMSHCSSLQDESLAIKLLGKIIELAIHPLSIPDRTIEQSSQLLSDFNNRLAYDKLVIKETKGEFQLIKLSQQPETRTSTDYVIDAINFFKNEYNKVRVSGLKYEYKIGDSVESLTFMFDVDEPHIQEAIDENRAGRDAIEQLHKVGFIKEYTIEERTVDVHFGCDYALCYIDENKLVQKEEPVATDFGSKKIIENVIKYELTHHFANSIQEKDMVMNHRYENNQAESFYITKEGDDFYYKGKFISISKDAEYYKVFSALFAKLPKGGEISYKDLIVEVKSRLPRLKTKTDDEVKKVIQSNLTEKQNGFIRNAGLPDTEDNGKALVYVSRGKGFVFNNRAG